MRRTRLEHQFVKSFPRPLEEGILYVSMEYSSAAHKCSCGCGNDVITRLSPADWRLSYDGRSVSLHPSIGNWDFPCQSHYWIRNDDVVWDVKWPKWRIDELRRYEMQSDGPPLKSRRSLWRKVRDYFETE
jgi:Family of unknown function (DUF6527)